MSQELESLSKQNADQQFFLFSSKFKNSQNKRSFQELLIKKLEESIEKRKDLEMEFQKKGLWSKLFNLKTIK